MGKIEKKYEEGEKGQGKQKENIQDSCSATVSQYPSFGYPKSYYHGLHPSMDMFLGYNPFQSGPRPMRQNFRREGNQGVAVFIVKKTVILFRTALSCMLKKINFL